jgi:signal-transduction protein with cAMP-binding, CBS, and nucleotidyltransferase domain
MNVKIDELMVSSVMSASPSQTIGRVRQVMSEHGVSAMPVLDSDGAPAGIVTARDLLADVSNDTPVSKVMSQPVYTVPRYGDPSLAARIMRNHRIHHVLVTEAKSVVGIVSSFDLLCLVEDHRYVAKNAPTRSERKGGSRKKAELGSN